VNRAYTDITVEHLEAFAKDGFRTLVVAYRVISEEEYGGWVAVWSRAVTSLSDRERKCQEAAELIERDLIILGATAIEDKLQMVSVFSVTFF
jgi:phospholipid-transporting ATPase